MNKLLTLAAGLCLMACAARAQKYVGGDISALPIYEEHGVEYLDQEGRQVQPLDYWYDHAGWNAARVRIFVDPTKAPADDKSEGVRQDLDDVTALCRRIKAKGYALLLDFHYADTWTDPSQHTTPSAWNSSDPKVLADSVYRYTAHVLRHLKAYGVEPELVQPGNEVTFGMMWPTGRCWPDGSGVVTTAQNSAGSSGTGEGTHANFVSYLKAGVRAIREVCPGAKVVVHTEMGSAWNVTTFYNTLGSQVDYDVIGLSYYPDYHGTLATLSSTLTTLETQHADKEIMIVETGYGARWSLNGNHTATVKATWPVTEAGQRQFATDLVAELHKHAGVTGLFWWLPEDNAYRAASPARSSWWNASLYNQETGRPYAALFELQRFIGKNPAGIASPTTSPSVLLPIYDVMGRKLPSSLSPNRLRPGLYISAGQKLLITR